MASRTPLQTKPAPEPDGRTLQWTVLRPLMMSSQFRRRCCRHPAQAQPRMQQIKSVPLNLPLCCHLGYAMLPCVYL